MYIHTCVYITVYSTSTYVLHDLRHDIFFIFFVLKNKTKRERKPNNEVTTYRGREIKPDIYNISVDTLIYFLFFSLCVLKTAQLFIPDVDRLFLSSV